MALEPSFSTDGGGGRDSVRIVLFLVGIGAGIAAFALPSSSHAASAYVRDGLAGVAAAIVSAGAFIAFAIVSKR